MGKNLSNDEIKFILSLEASGLQAEIGKSSAAIDKFAEENKALQGELKKLNKEMRETERQMLYLEKASKTNTEEYKNLSNAYESTKKKIAETNTVIAENNAQTERNRQLVKEGIKLLEVQDMTMNQLKGRAKELQKQFDNTAKSTSPAEYEKFQKQIKEVDKRMSELGESGKGMMSKLSAIPGPVGQVSQSLVGMGRAMMALVANPVGAVIAAIVLVFMAFKKAINSSEEATEKFNQLLAPLAKWFNMLLGLLQKIVIGFLKLAEVALNGFTKMLEKLPFIGEKMKQINESAREAIQLEKEKQQLDKKERDWISEKAKLENEIAKNRDKAAQKDRYNVKERLEFLDKALSGEMAITEENVKQAREKYRIAVLEAGRKTDQTEEEKRRIADLLAAVTNAQTQMYENTRAIHQKRTAFIKEEENDQKEAAKEALKRQKDNLDAQLNDLESNYNQRVAVIKKSGIQDSKTETEINVSIAAEEQLLYQDRIKALKEYLTKVKDEKLRSEIVKKISENELSVVENQKKSDELKISLLRESLDRQLKIVDSSYNVQALTFQEALADRKISQEQYDMLIMMLDKTTSDSRVTIMKGYQDDVNALEIKTGDLKLKAVEDANEKVVAAETDAANKRKAVFQTIAESAIDFKRQFGLLTYDEEMKIQLKILEDVYKAQLEFLQKNGMSTLEWTTYYEKAKTKIILDAEQERYNQRQQLGLTTWQEDFENEKKRLQDLLDAKKITQDEFDQANFNNQVGYYKAWFDYYEGLAKAAVQAIQDAEISSMEATYDEKIAAAGDNADEVTRLEREKAQKKLDIEKKYADVNFAIKASEIIANTAVAIMQAVAQLGPVAGTIAAVLMAATGAAQLVSANAERRKVKAMTLDSAGSSSSSQTRIVTGKEEGGYLEVTRDQDKKRFWARNKGKKRGYINETSLLVSENGGEFVANSKAVSNPTIRPILDIIDSAQRGGYIDQLNLKAILASSGSRGMQFGGYVNQPAAAPRSNDPYVINNFDEDLMIEIRDLLRYLKQNGVKAPIVLSELQKQIALQELSDSYATKS